MQDNAWRISESLRESIMKEIDKSANYQYICKII